MITDATHVTVLVEDADDAIEWYTEVLGFEPGDVEEYAPGMRWVTVRPPGDGPEFVLQEITDEGWGDDAERYRERIGQATMTVLAVDGCRETVETLRDRGVTVREEPSEQPWGVSAVIEDLYGNPYNLLEPAG